MTAVWRSTRVRVVGAVVIVAAGLVAGSAAMATAKNYQFTGCLHAGNLTKVKLGTHPLHACSAGSTKVTWNSQGPAGLNGKNGSNGVNGVNGTNGTNGTNGANGTSALSTATAPVSGCTTGDTDLDRATGELYTCAAGAWVDSGSSLMGPRGATGVRGATGSAGVVGAKIYSWTVNIQANSVISSDYDGSTSIPAGSTISYIGGNLTVGTCQDGSGGTILLETSPYLGWITNWRTGTTTAVGGNYPVTTNGNAVMALSSGCHDGSFPATSGSCEFEVTPGPTTYN